MSEERRALPEAIREYSPDPGEGLARTLERARRRQLRRRVAGGAAGLVLTAAAAAVTWAAIPAGRSARPLVGPTPTPTAPLETFAPEDATTFCSDFRRRRFCLTRTSPVVTLAEGTRDGHRWSLRAYAARFTGPVRLERSSSPRRSVLMMCRGWAWFNDPEWFCASTVPEDAMFGISLGRSMEPSEEPEPAPMLSDETRPLQGLEESGGGFSADTTGSEHASLVWTPDETARVTVAVDGSAAPDAMLFGPFPELNANLKVVVTFFPLAARSVVYTAYDASGSILWREHDRFP